MSRAAAAGGAAGGAERGAGGRLSRAAPGLAVPVAWAGSAPGALMEQVWAPLRDAAYLVGGIGMGRQRRGSSPVRARAAAAPATGGRPAASSP
jgi:hypothetical protein